jgi:DNA-binding NarL/FixJ family response regulator
MLRLCNLGRGLSLTGGARVIRLGVIDDHPVFRLGLVRSLERELDLAVLWELGTVSGLDKMLDACPVDVVLMDLNLGPEDDALAATRAVREKYDSVKVIVISASLDWEAAQASRAAGASGYLPKDLAVADMVAAIRGLSSPDFGRRAFNDLLGARPGGNGTHLTMRRGLTRREQEVLVELQHGRTNKEISARLNVSIATVNKHVQQVLKKLHVRTRTQAVAMVNADQSGRRYLVSETRR